MRIHLLAAFSSALLVAACGGGQTEPTEAEEALANDVQPAAPSPGTVLPIGSEAEVANGAATAPETGNSQ